MQKTAYVKLIGLSLPQVDRAVAKVIRSSPRMNIDVVGTPKAENVHWSRKRGRVCGCEGVVLRRKAIPVRGTRDNIKKVLKLDLPEDVYIQLSV